MDFTTILIGMIPTALTGTILYYWQRKQRRHDEKMDKRAEARRCESLLLLNMQMATAKLAYASAMALKRGTPNGEVEEGVEAFEEAKKRYTSFLNEQAKEHLMEG